ISSACRLTPSSSTSMRAWPVDISVMYPIPGHARRATLLDYAGKGRRRMETAKKPFFSGRRLWVGAAILVAVVGGAAWFVLSKPPLPPGFAGGNGRLEANMIYISTKYPGRIKEVLYNEGDTIEAGQVVARMDTSALEAQLREALAQIKAAEDNRD